MSDAPDITTSDRGKTVVTQGGDEIGQITSVMNHVAVVEEPEEGLADSIRSRFDWEHTSDDNKYTMKEEQIDEITDDTVVVSGASK